MSNLSIFTLEKENCLHNRCLIIRLWHPPVGYENEVICLHMLFLFFKVSKIIRVYCVHIPTIKIKQLACNVSLFILPPVQELIRAFITDLTFGFLACFSFSLHGVLCFFLVIQKISLFIKCKHFGQICFSLKYNTHIQFLTNLLDHHSM